MRGCLLIHGFTGSPHEVEPLAEHIKKLGFFTLTPILAGHNGSKRDMKSYTWLDWIGSAEDALTELKRKCKTVDIIGFSMGGLIAAHLARKYEVRRLVLLSAAAYYMNHAQMIKDLMLCLKNESDNDEMKDLFKRYYEKAKETPIISVWNFRKLVRNLRPAFSQVSIPSLVIQGECDNLVVPRSADYIYNQLQSTWKELVYFPKSKHIICHDCEKELLFETIESFLEKDENAEIEENNETASYPEYIVNEEIGGRTETKWI